MGDEKPSVVNWVVVLVLVGVVNSVLGRSTVQITATPPIDLDNLEEGNAVVLRCEATGLPTGYTLHWQHGTEDLVESDRVSLDSESSLGRGDASWNMATVLTVSGILGRDRGIYRCQVRHGQTVISSSEVTLTVYSFPPESSPLCSPSGDLTVYEGDVLALNCSSLKGYPTVNVSISSTTAVPEEWSTEDTEDVIARASIFTVSPAHDGARFSCTISSWRYPSKQQTCTIGPIHVKQKTPSTILPASTDFRVPPTPTPTPSTTSDAPRDNFASQIDTALLFGGGSLLITLLVLSVILNFILCCRRQKSRVRAEEIHLKCHRCFLENRRMTSLRHVALNDFSTTISRSSLPDAWI